MSDPPPMGVPGALQAAIAHHQAGRLGEAEALYRQILAQVPQHADALHFLGLLAHQTGDPATAVALIGQALQRAPRHAPCHLHLGLALQALGRLVEAQASYLQALACDANLAEAHNNLGYVLLELGEAERALPCLDRALGLRPDFPEALNNRGLALEALGRPDEALGSLDQALQMRPDYPEALLNRGNALQALGRLDEARDSYCRSLELRPGHPDTISNLGQALEARGLVHEAIACYRQAQAQQPELATPYWNEALARLRLGEFEAGWRLYEWRWRAVGHRTLVRNFAEPRWQGDTPLAGRTIFLHYEQGFGDTLQMLRYAPVLASQGARVLVEVPPAMAALAATLPAAPPGSIAVVVEGSVVPPFDLQCPLMSLPLACGTTLETVPATVPYLAPPERERALWRQRLGERTRRRVGLAWAGSQGNTAAMRLRCIPLGLLLDRLDPGVEWHSLQKEYRSGDLELLAADGRIRDHAKALTDFTATAGLIDQLDLVITVDTAVAHLAGAMAKPVWLLLQFAADYRWLQDREDSPWYPTMRLFRQPASGDWGSVLGAVADALLRE
ncbi:MAG: tetratricopeptide repeat-containing glycosyltransferase family protein [Gammaproteobacteria bacterium]|nr:tetratricopeptide repeat-containing glycosyltransferase family protein [Gammaproteobacteria bacterium]